MAAPTVFVVDDDPALRDSLNFLIRSVGLPVETFGSANEFLAACDPARSGCLLVDIRMPGVSGLELLERLRGRGVDTPAIVITAHGDVPAAVRAMKAGAVDFLEKPFNDQLLLDAIHRALEADARERRARSKRDELSERIEELTPREREVMDLVVDGKSTKEIAQSLGLSTKTVETHRVRIMEKMQAGNIAELVRLALTVHPPGE